MVKVPRKKTKKESKPAPRRGSFTREKLPSRKGAKKREKMKQKQLKTVSQNNVFENLPESVDKESDDELVVVSDASYSESDSESGNPPNKNDVIVIDDADDDGDEVINISDISNSDNSDTDEQPPQKRRRTNSDSLDIHQDYIAFDMSDNDNSPDDMAGYDPAPSGYDEIDNAYLSNDDGGSTYHPAASAHPVGEINPNYPWIRNNDHTKQKSMADWLTTEIVDFIKYISPSADEIRARNDLIHNLRSHITKMWPDADLLCFGSYATDLYLPGSDIDCVVVTKRGAPKYDTKNALYKLTSYIRSNGLGIEVVPIAKAKVPIIKFVDPKTKIHIDVSFERTNGLTAAKLIIEWIRTTPGLRELVLIIKQFLASRRLNEVHTGGLGGFAIICLVYAFLKLHPRLATNSIDPLENLGVLLIEFLELYGYNFGYDNVALAFTTPAQNSNEPPQPIYISKSSNASLLNRNMFALSIQDPHDPLNNITRGTYNLRDIKRAFGGAFELLVNQCYTLQASTFKQRLGQSILGGIIKWKGRRRSFGDARSEVNNLAMSEVVKEDEQGEPPKKKSKKDKKGKKDKKDKKSKKDKKKKSKQPADEEPQYINGLPLLPTQKAGIDTDSINLSDSYISMSDEDTRPNAQNYDDIVTRFAESQQSNRTTNKTVTELFGIEDEEEVDEDENYQPPKTINFRNASAVAVAKDKRREYWDLKSGKTF